MSFGKAAAGASLLSKRKAPNEWDVLECSSIVGIFRNQSFLLDYELPGVALAQTDQNYGTLDHLSAATRTYEYRSPNYDHVQLWNIR